MSQFDVYRNPDNRTRRRAPYWLDLQSNFLSDLGSRIVVPLATVADFGPPVLRLNPLFEIDGTKCVMATAEMGAVPRHLLKRSITSLAWARDQIVVALDFIIHGY